MLGLEYSRQLRVGLSYVKTNDSDLDFWKSTLNVEVSKYSSSMLILPILASLLARILGQDKWPVLYVPHLSKSIFTQNQLFVLQLVLKFDLISFYDDGMALISSSGILWKRGFLPCEQNELIGWRYSFQKNSRPLKTVSISSAYTHLVNSLGLTNSLNDSMNPEGAHSFFGDKRLIIASKWIDWDALDRLEPLANSSRYYYVNHYRESKNNPLYAQALSSWNAFPSLELSLPSRISTFSHCYFGVTSSIFFLLEVLLALQVPSDTVFVPIIALGSCEYPLEAADFLQALSSYADRFNFEYSV